jgi:hypothetical protein
MKTLPTRPIETVFINFKGDNNFGHGYEMTVFLDPDSFVVNGIEKELEHYRKQISDLYEVMHGDKPTVLFDFECEGTNEPNEDMDGDAQSALASAGFGTDEDYGGGDGHY